MSTLVAKKSVTRKKTAPRLSPIPSAVDEHGRLRPGYAAGFASIRPGVDLTKPTAAVGKYL